MTDKTYSSAESEPKKLKKEKEINYQAWSESLIGFIRSKGLERECTDWCGGWKCPIPAPAQSARLTDVACYVERSKVRT
jgi:hypothetical protein